MEDKYSVLWQVLRFSLCFWSALIQGNNFNRGQKYAKTSIKKWAIKSAFIFSPFFFFLSSLLTFFQRHKVTRKFRILKIHLCKFYWSNCISVKYHIKQTNFSKQFHLNRRMPIISSFYYACHLRENHYGLL